MPSTSGFRARVAALSHPGLIRGSNEDAVLVGKWISQDAATVPWTGSWPLDQPLLCAVADGLGGHGGGGIASRLVLQEMRDLAEALTGGEGAIAAALRAIHLRLRSLNRPGGPAVPAGPGSTIAGLLLQANEALAFNVGDSRVYRLREGFLTQISTDDVPERLYGDVGGQRPSHLVSQCLGVLDVEPEPHIQVVGASEGDGFLLCTDGLTAMLDLEQMEKILAEKGLSEPQVAVAEMADQALEAGGLDNLSIILVGVESMPHHQ